MSRIGKKPIVVPSGVTAAIAGQTVTIKGPKGELAVNAHPKVKVEVKGKGIRYEGEQVKRKAGKAFASAT